MPSGKPTKQGADLSGTTGQLLESCSLLTAICQYPILENERNRETEIKKRHNDNTDILNAGEDAISKDGNAEL